MENCRDNAINCRNKRCRRILRPHRGYVTLIITSRRSWRSMTASRILLLNALIRHTSKSIKNWEKCMILSWWTKPEHPNVRSISNVWTSIWRVVNKIAVLFWCFYREIMAFHLHRLTKMVMKYLLIQFSTILRNKIKLYLNWRVVSTMCNLSATDWRSKLRVRKDRLSQLIDVCSNKKKLELVWKRWGLTVLPRKFLPMIMRPWNIKLFRVRSWIRKNRRYRNWIRRWANLSRNRIKIICHMKRE